MSEIGPSESEDVNQEQIENAKQEIEDIVSSLAEDIIGFVETEMSTHPDGGEVNISLGDSLPVETVILLSQHPEFYPDPSGLAEPLGLPAGTTIIGIGFDPELGCSILIRFPATQKEQEENPETRETTFANKCSFCGEAVTVTESVPLTRAGKVKRDKRSGRKYRDWDWKDEQGSTFYEHTCVTTRERHRLQLFEREWLD